jgi:hypothetical protein
LNLSGVHISNCPVARLLHQFWSIRLFLVFLCFAPMMRTAFPYNPANFIAIPGAHTRHPVVSVQTSLVDNDRIIACLARLDEVRQQILDLRGKSGFPLLWFFPRHDWHAALLFFFGAG